MSYWKAYVVHQPGWKACKVTIYNQKKNQGRSETDCEILNQSNQTGGHKVEGQTPASCQITKPPHYGYTVTIDNVDINIRQSFQRLDLTTQSYHFCHVFAVLIVQC